MWKICTRKILNVNLIFFNSLTSVIAEFSTSNFIFVISLQKKIEPSVFFLSILQFIWQDLAIACKSFNWRKSINRWNLMNEQNQPIRSYSEKKRYSSKQLFYRVSTWLYNQNLRKILVKKVNFSQVADL